MLLKALGLLKRGILLDLVRENHRWEEVVALKCQVTPQLIRSLYDQLVGSKGAVEAIRFIVGGLGHRVSVEQLDEVIG